MSIISAKKKPPLPRWWKPELYNYLETMTLHGWVWEFMRRSKLKRMLKGKSVEAMKPAGGFRSGGTKKRREEIQLLSLTWPLASMIPEFKNKLLWLPPAITRETGGSATSSELQSREQSYIENAIDSSESKLFDFRIDLNRRNTVLYREFRKIVSGLRKQHPEPGRRGPRPEVWRDNKFLQVWDLYQYQIEWKEIMEKLGFNTKQSARNQRYRAAKQIEGNGWYGLALYVEAEE
jgi:hypothetical protein